MHKVFLLVGSVVVLLSSCVPNRKLVYVQKDDLHKRDIPLDTVLRSHALIIEEYRIQPLDMLGINFETLGEENDKFDFLDKLSPQQRAGGGGGSGGSSQNGLLVDPEGNIDYAVLGKIHLGGLSLFEARDTLQKVASRYVSDVVVRVRMLNFRFTILGEVNGEKTVQSSNTRVNLMEAIGMAGGLTEMADRTRVKVIRQHGAETDVFYVDLLQEELLESKHYYVQQNDIIVVPPLRQRPFRRYFTSNLAVITSTASVVLLVITLYNK